MLSINPRLFLFSLDVFLTVVLRSRYRVGGGHKIDTYEISQETNLSLQH
jgi:hypothetical protein